MRLFQKTNQYEGPLHVRFCFFLAPSQLSRCYVTPSQAIGMFLGDSVWQGA